MARTKNTVTLQEQLEKIDAEIEMCKEKLSKLRKKRKMIEEKINTDQGKELNKILRSKGKTFEDLKEMLEK